MFEIREVKTRRELNQFIGLQYRLYRDDPNFVPPLRSQMRDMLLGGNNMLFTYGPHALLLLKRDGRAIGRIMVGVNHRFNEENHYKSAWFSLFECEHDEQAASALLRAAEDWALAQGMEYLRGPEPPDNGDTFKGLLVMGFDGPPAMMNSYNPPWYGTAFDTFGLEKYLDLYSYYFTRKAFEGKNIGNVVQYAMKKFGYHVDTIDRKNLDRDVRDIHRILAETLPTDPNERMAVPSVEDVYKMARTMLPIADDGLICIARANGTNRPIGYVVALPEYNQVFRHIRGGRMFPLGIFQLLWYRKKIDAIRILMQFAVPDYQNKGLTGAMYMKMYETLLRHGYIGGDGSTIGENNMPSRLTVEKLGGEHYRTFRMYKKRITR